MSQKRILIVGLNWIGDAVMSMPAIQACRAENPTAHITMLCKPYLEALWEMHPAIDAILFRKKSLRETGQEIAAHKFDVAYILPNSLSTAAIPFLGKVRLRIGLRGSWRSLLLSKIIPLSGGHQSNEYFPIIAPDSVDLVKELPQLTVPAHDYSEFGSYAVLMPGAARGASKMWPIASFERLARKLLNEADLNIVFAGGPGDAEACEELADRLGDRSHSVAGKTTLKEWASLLSQAVVAVANDSGGMHLAGAVGAPIVGIFGMTNPDKTGPLAVSYRVVQQSTQKSRDIARDSEAAQLALSAITPDEVYRAVDSLLAK